MGKRENVIRGLKAAVTVAQRMVDANEIDLKRGYKIPPYMVTDNKRKLTVAKWKLEAALKKG